MLGAGGKRQRLPNICVGYSGQKHGPQMIRMLAHIDQRSDCSVRCCHQINLLVAQSRPNFIQIVHGDWGCVEGQVCDLIQLLSALAHLIKRKEFTEELLKVGRIVA